jgi:hypothetical protein
MGIDWGGIDQSIISSLTTPSLIQASVLFTNLYNINVTHDILLQAGREHDQLNMPSLEALQMPIEDLKACNHCRIFLTALFLSDLVTGDGRDISEDAWYGHHPLPGDRHTSWPSYARPTNSSWRIWQHCIRKAFVSRGRHLRRPLGACLRFNDAWPWYVTPEGELYQLKAGKWYAHPMVVKRRRLPAFDSKGISCEAPATILRAVTYQKGQRIICLGAAPILPTLAP